MFCITTLGKSNHIWSFKIECPESYQLFSLTYNGARLVSLPSPDGTLKVWIPDGAKIIDATFTGHVVFSEEGYLPWVQFDVDLTKQKNSYDDGETEYEEDNDGHNYR